MTVPFVHDPATAELLGPKLAVSFHVVGESGPITWHAKALTTSYLTAPGAGAKGESEDEYAFPFGTASWYFLDALDMMVPADARGIVAFGDSISDGTASTMNGDDRGPSAKDRLDRDVLSLSRIAAVVWLEGINDFDKSGNASVDDFVQ